MCGRKYARPAFERFTEKVELNGPIPVHRPELGPCHVWEAGLSKTGYGKFREGGRGSKHWRAHRFIYQLVIGSLQSGNQLDHLCRNKACVNILHLEEVTARENMRRSMPFRKHGRESA